MSRLAGSTACALLLLCTGAPASAGQPSSSGSDPRVLIDRYHLPRGCDDRRTRRSELGDYVQVHFNGTVGTDGKGKLFDSTHTHASPGQVEGTPVPPMEFRITTTLEGGGMFVPGWEQAIVGMCLGERRHAIIPPALAFGDAGFPKGGIPGGASLHFDIAMLVMSDEPSDTFVSPYPNMFREMDSDGDKRVTRAEMRAWFDKMAASEHGADLPSQGAEGMMGLFDKDDVDKDGFVSFDEFSGPKGLPPQTVPTDASPPADVHTELAGGVKMQAGVVDKDGNVVGLPAPVTPAQAKAMEETGGNDGGGNGGDSNGDDFVRLGAEFDVADGDATPELPNSDADVPEVGHDEL